jgi:hypothetical protein
MLTGIHFLLTYSCTFECDHCFVHGSPRAGGVFTLAQLRAAFAQIREVPGIEEVYFEGGEPFLFYPLLVEGFRLARESGLRAGLVTNAYWAASEEDAELWLRPLRDLGCSDFSVSDDDFHSNGGSAKYALQAAASLGIPRDSICIDPQQDLLLRGRAADKLSQDRPRRPLAELNTCPEEDLADPGRVHVDPFGNVHLCQGLLLGNIWATPLAQLLREYDPPNHPIAGPLLRGGPASLAQARGLPAEQSFASECHACYELRKVLQPNHPAVLGPPQVYGLTQG